AANLADKVEIQFAYAIGHPQPVSVCIDTFGTEKVPFARIEKAVHNTFDFRPAEIIRQLRLRRPIYSKTTNYGHFGHRGKPAYAPWEHTDRVRELRRHAGCK
ncbi:MAG: methionine adenosyltransferase, partial [Verrucomicrobia bacterium]|nr:methionine adenosyltransferase [Verrucomicrobiota bacterium]